MDKPQFEANSLPPSMVTVVSEPQESSSPSVWGEGGFLLGYRPCRLPNCVLHAILILPSEVLVSRPTAYLLRSLKASSAAFFRACTLNSGEFYSLFTDACRACEHGPGPRHSCPGA